MSSAVYYKTLKGIPRKKYIIKQLQYEYQVKHMEFFLQYLHHCIQKMQQKVWSSSVIMPEYQTHCKCHQPGLQGASELAA